MLDTNIVSAWLQDEKIIADKIDNANEIYIPVIVIGEMYYGAQYSARVQQNINNISKALSHYPLLTIDEDTCKQYGIIKASLRRKGKPIPEMTFGFRLLRFNIILQLLQEMDIIKK